jgi:hypothetical protein
VSSELGEPACNAAGGLLNGWIGRSWELDVTVPGGVPEIEYRVSVLVDPNPVLTKY